MPCQMAQPQLSPAPGTPGLETATSDARWYIGSQRGIVFSYRLDGSTPADVDVNLIRQSDDAVVQSWHQTQVAPGVVQTVRWTGAIGGILQPEGRYAFRAVVSSGDVAQSSTSTDDASRDAFELFEHIFPVRGRHDYGGAGNRFGAARAGHSHQGCADNRRGGQPRRDQVDEAAQRSNETDPYKQVRSLTGGQAGDDHRRLHRSEEHQRPRAQVVQHEPGGPAPTKDR